MSAGHEPPLLVLVGIEAELAGLRRAFRSVEKRQADESVAERGWLGGRDAIVVCTGPGRVNAVAGAAWGLAWGEGASAVVAAGFCSGLREDLAYGDLFIPDVVDGEAEAVERHAGRKPPPALRPAPALCRLATREAERIGSRVRTGTLVTVEVPLRSVEQKRTLARVTGGSAADGETAAYGPATGGWGVPVVVVRVVVDAIGEAPPNDRELGIEREGRRRRRMPRAPSGVRRAFQEVVSAARDVLGIPERPRRVAGAAEVLGEVVGRFAGAL